MLWCAENESCEFILIARRLVRQGYYFLREHLAIDKAKGRRQSLVWTHPFAFKQMETIHVI